ncbi:hypothetical protein EYA88_21000 [Burkholderia pseudomallei]|nr:hypothetical protein EYA88_21000 [Burkholderia pseudomallei]
MRQLSVERRRVVARSERAVAAGVVQRRAAVALPRLGGRKAGAGRAQVGHKSGTSAGASRTRVGRSVRARSAGSTLGREGRLSARRP